jgi:hypothetical protein
LQVEARTIAKKARASRDIFHKGVDSGRKPCHCVDDMKSTKSAAHYQEHPAGTQKCSKCRMFRDTAAYTVNVAPTCTAVKGEISPDGWCRFFESRSK